MKGINIAAVQMDIAWHDRSVNLEKVYTFANRACNAGVDILVLPEMFSTGFSIDSSFTAEFLDGITPSFLRSIAREFNMNVIGGFVLDMEGEGIRNVALTVDRNGNDLSLYSKMHLIKFLGEDVCHSPGDAPLLFNIDGLNSSCFICYDLRFPEIFRSVIDDCEVMFVIASWPAVRQKHWDILLRARAVENQCYVVGVNRVGVGGGHIFNGGSVIVDPAGEIIADAEDKETLLTAEISKDRVAEIRGAMPFLQDRRFMFNKYDIR